LKKHLHSVFSFYFYVLISKEHMKKKLKADCFSIVNANGEQVLFRTDDVSLNKFTFSIINNTGEDLALTGNTEGTASSFKFNFETMLTADVVQHMELVLPDSWAATFNEGSDTVPPSWSVYPTVDTVLAKGSIANILLGNISCADTAPGNFSIGYRDIPDYQDSIFPIAKHLTVINPPDAKKKTLPLQGSYTRVVHPVQGQYLQLAEEADGKVSNDIKAVEIYITYDPGAQIENGFTYLLANTSKDPLVPANLEIGDLVGVPEPTLYISFLFGEDDHDITTQKLADNNISIDVSAALSWLPVKHLGGTAYWQFLPTSTEIMKAYETVSFPIHRIITALNVTPETTSIMYIQVNNIPGYNDASYTILLHKLLAQAKMESLDADKYFIYGDENISISWTSSLAKRVTIEYYLKDDKRVFLDSVIGDIKLNGKNFLLPVPPSAENTIITAIAYDDKGYNSRQIHIIVSYNYPQAEILSFTVGEMMATQAASLGDILFALAWKVKWAKRTVVNYTWGDHPIDVPLTKNGIDIPVNTSIHSWVDFTLSVYSKGENHPVPARKTIQLRNLG
jgi:hypothetical protein